MASQRQIQMNRCKAQKSTEPKTEVGRHRLRLNALKHGLSRSLPTATAADPLVPSPEPSPERTSVTQMPWRRRSRAWWTTSTSSPSAACRQAPGRLAAALAERGRLAAD